MLSSEAGLILKSDSKDGVYYLQDDPVPGQRPKIPLKGI